jgi:uncharacterized protein (DUF362 family)
MAYPTRRDTLRYLASGVAVAGLGAPIPAALGQSLPDIAVVQGGDVAARVRQVVAEMGGIGRFVSRGDRVVVKPNIGFGNPPERGSTTDPRVVRTIVKLALEAGARQVTVFDNPCHHAEIALDISGIQKALADVDQVACYNLAGSKLFREVPIPSGKALKKQEVATDILEADTIINVPCAKSHGATRVSFGLKNWMGVVKDRKWWHVAVDLNQAIADLATIIRPKLTILDATRALVTGGPSGPGDVRELGTLVAGVDPLSIDVFALGLAPWGGAGFTVDQIPYLRKAAEIGVGQLDISGLVIRRVVM